MIQDHEMTNGKIIDGIKKRGNIVLNGIALYKYSCNCVHGEVSRWRKNVLGR